MGKDLTAMTKIYITGAPGSGKSYLARRLAAKLDIPWYDLDSDHLYDLNHDDRDAYYQQLLTQDSWICEAVTLGLHTKWVEVADLVVLLETPLAYRVWRILLRTVLKGLGVTFSGQEGRETWYKLRYRLQETWRYDERHKIPFLSTCTLYQDRIHVFSDNSHARRWLLKTIKYRRLTTKIGAPRV